MEPRSYFVFIGDETAPFLNIALRAKKVVRNKNLKKSWQEARRGKMSFFAYFKEEFQVIQERDPAIHSPMEVLLYPSFRVMLKYRRAHKLYLKGHYFLARWISQRAARKTGIEIHPGATIGKGLFIDHGSGVIIGETAIIGDNVTLYQGVTLGGNGKETGKRHPTLKDNVMVSAGAKIIGSFTIGENSKIGAGSVVIEEVPPNCTVVGVPGHIVKQNDVRIPRKSMDHIHLPDPIFEDIKVLQQENTELTNRVLELEGELRQMRKKERTEVTEVGKETENEELFPEAVFGEKDYLSEVFGLEQHDIRMYSPLTLAYIGDAAYEIVIRTILVRKANMQVNKLHRHAAGLVKAEKQSAMIEILEPLFTEEEKQIYKRGRNAKSYTKAKNASTIDYRRATGFEAVMGYLYLKGDYKRMIDLIRAGLGEV